MAITESMSDSLSSMKESLEKIQKTNEALAGFMQTSIEDSVEGDRAQRLRDKEQKTQTGFLAGIFKKGKDDKKGESFFSKHWGKLLLAGLAIFGLMKMPLKNFAIIKDAIINMTNMVVQVMQKVSAAIDRLLKWLLGPATKIEDPGTEPQTTQAALDKALRKGRSGVHPEGFLKRTLKKIGGFVMKPVRTVMDIGQKVGGSAKRGWATAMNIKSVYESPLMSKKIQPNVDRQRFAPEAFQFEKTSKAVRLGPDRETFNKAQQTKREAFNKVMNDGVKNLKPDPKTGKISPEKIAKTKKDVTRILKSGVKTFGNTMLMTRGNYVLSALATAGDVAYESLLSDEQRNTLVQKSKELKRTTFGSIFGSRTRLAEQGLFPDNVLGLKPWMKPGSFDMNLGQLPPDVRQDVIRQEKNSQVEAAKRIPKDAGPEMKAAIDRQLMRQEGFEGGVYEENFGRGKVPTIGYGFNLTKNNADSLLKAAGINFSAAELIAGQGKINKTQAHKLMIQDRKNARIDAISFVGGIEKFDSLNPMARNVLQNMAFNLGLTRLSSFTNLKKALTGKGGPNYQRAANEMMYNTDPKTGVRTKTLWATQVKTRADELTAQMRSIGPGNPNQAGTFLNSSLGTPGTGAGNTVIKDSFNSPTTNNVPQTQSILPSGSTSVDTDQSQRYGVFGWVWRKWNN